MSYGYGHKYHGPSHTDRGRAHKIVARAVAVGLLEVELQDGLSKVSASQVLKYEEEWTAAVQKAEAVANKAAEKARQEEESARLAAQEAEAAQEETAPMSAAVIVTALRTAGKTVRELAAAIGCAISTVYRWARGTHQPSNRYAAVLAALAI